MEIHIDQFGHIVNKSECKYTVTLTGSVTPCRSGNGYWYEVEKHPPPPIPIDYVFSREILIFKN